MTDPVTDLSLSSSSSRYLVASVFYYLLDGQGLWPRLLVTAATLLLFFVGPRILDFVPRLLGRSPLSPCPPSLLLLITDGWQRV